MLPGSRVMVDVDPISISCAPTQLATLCTVLAALRTEAQRTPAATRQQDPVAERNSLPVQLLPEVRPLLRCCLAFRERPRNGVVSLPSVLSELHWTEEVIRQSQQGLYILYICQYRLVKVNLACVRLGL